MKKMILCAVVAILIMSVQGYGKEKQKIAVVDLQRILVESSAGKKAKKALGDIYEQKKKELDQKQNELNKIKDELDKKKTVLSEKVVREKQMDFENRRLDFLQQVQKYEQELKEKDAEMTQTIVKDVSDIVKRIAKKENYAFVIEKTEGGLLYFDEDYDITDRVVKEYNSESAK